VNRTGTTLGARSGNIAPIATLQADDSFTLAGLADARRLRNFRLDRRHYRLQPHQRGL